MKSANPKGVPEAPARPGRCSPRTAACSWADMSLMPSDRAAKGSHPPAGLEGNQASSSCPCLQKGHSQDPTQRSKTTLPCPAPFFLRKTKPNPAKGLASNPARPPLRYSIPGLPFLQTVALSINLVRPSPLAVMGISFPSYYFALSINQPVVDHANGIINLGDSRKIDGAVHYRTGHHGFEKVRVNLGCWLGLELACL